MERERRGGGGMNDRMHVEMRLCVVGATWPRVNKGSRERRGEGGEGQREERRRAERGERGGCMRRRAGGGTRRSDRSAGSSVKPNT